MSIARLIACLFLVTSCSGTVLQTQNETVICVRGNRVELSSVIDPRIYELVFIRGKYELRLIDSHRVVAKYDRCEIEIDTRSRDP